MVVPACVKFAFAVAAAPPHLAMGALNEKNVQRNGVVVCLGVLGCVVFVLCVCVGVRAASTRWR